MFKPPFLYRHYHLLFFAMFSVHFFVSAQRGVSDSYSIHFDSSQPKVVQVAASLTMEDDTLRMSHYGPMPERWPDYVKNIEVKDESGQPQTVEERDAGWIIPNLESGTRIQLNYDLYVDHEDINWPGGIDGVAFVRPWGIMLSGRCLFVVNGSDKENILVEVRLPENHHISVPWKQEPGNENAYIVPNLLQLQESLMFAGTHKEVVIPRGDFSLKFVLGGEDILKQETQFVNTAKSVLDYYIDLMGGNPLPSPGYDLSTAMVIINQSESTDGEVIGNHLSMFINPKGDMQNQMAGWFMFAHEFYHLWNGKTLRFQDSSTDWFKEGVTSYYTLKALNQVGMVNEDISGMILNNLFYQRYVNDSGYGQMAPANAASGFDKDNHWGLVYGGGLFAGVCLDMEIRKNTENQDSLDDVMRRLYAEYGGKDALIDQQTLINYAGQQGQTNFSDFAETHITGASPVPLKEYLLHAGVQVYQEGGQLILSHKPQKTTLQQQIWEGFLGAN
ncbi:M61 family metallopeptidase [Lentiprolixibacter aurantiacus]|uniref:Peptidase M61 catalytic domain-containing protein n=1 Tax=Lentiprolixibacter aurantiacus TaxID=2993939 RepID=A0AAE3MK40_9FLAO|nr:hypothetical protein [Lentiprolixibacter aurantiacus]MCX2718894.1 hypothetical protein [Lentiprolixibacter aurantiacus]